MASTTATETKKRAAPSAGGASEGAVAAAAAADLDNQHPQQTHLHQPQHQDDIDNQEADHKPKQQQQQRLQPDSNSNSNSNGNTNNSPDEHQNHHEPAVTAPQPKRRRVADDARLRSAKACQRCRRLKEKCDGRQPCARCQRSGRDCEFAPPATAGAAVVSSSGAGAAGAAAAAGGSHGASQAKSGASSTVSRHSSTAPSAQLGILADAALRGDGQQAIAVTARHEERTKCLERLVQHLLGDVPMDLNNLRRMVDKAGQRLGSKSDAGSVRGGMEDLDDLTLEDENFTVKALSQSTTHYSGEFSHWNFSQKLRRRLSQCMDSNMSLSSFRRDHLRGGSLAASSSSSLASSAANRVPPRAKTNANMRILEYWRATQLQSPKQLVQSVLSCLPPRAVSNFLVQIYFQFAQVNCFYAEEAWLRKKLDFLYEAPGHVTSEDSAWVCSVLMVLAIGTQFAHMAAGPPPPHDDPMHHEYKPPAAAMAGSADADVGVTFYQMASKLIPDIITIASLESVQACLLLAHYALPLDTQGLAYTYLGLGIKMAIQNGMHRRYAGTDLDAWTIETRNRLWWTAYTVERRVSVLHGRPASIAPTEVDAELPKDSTAPGQLDEVSRINNMSALIDMTLRLGDAANAITLLRRCPKNLQPTYFERIVDICQSLHAWWSTLPPECQNPSPCSPLFRSNVHLKLCLHLNDIFVGRPFIFSSTPTGSSPASVSSPGAMSVSAPASASASAARRPGTSGSSPLATTATTTTTTTSGDQKQPAGSAHSSSNNIPHPRPRPRSRASLVARAVEAAINVIHLLHTLHATTGLARSSYTEFSSCRAALLVMLAQSVNTGPQNEELKEAIDAGMVLIRGMAAGNVSTQSETSVIEALEIAVRRLHEMQQAQLERNEDGVGDGGGGSDGCDVDGQGRSGHGNGEGVGENGDRMDVGKSGYERFREWASLWPVSGNAEASSQQHPHHPQHNHHHHHHQQSHHHSQTQQQQQQQQQHDDEGRHIPAHGRGTPSLAFATMRTPPFYNVPSSSMDRGSSWMPNGGGGGGGGSSSLMEHSPESSRWLTMVDPTGLGIGPEQLEDLGLFGGFPELGALDGWPGAS